MLIPFSVGLIASNYNAGAFLVDERNAASLVAAARAFDGCDAKALINIRVGKNHAEWWKPCDNRAQVKTKPDEAQKTMSLALPKAARNRRDKHELLENTSGNGSVISGSSGRGGGGSVVDEGTGW